MKLKTSPSVTPPVARSRTARSNVARSDITIVALRPAQLAGERRKMRGASAGDRVDALLRRPGGVWPRLDESEGQESTYVHLHESGFPIRRSGNGVHRSHSRTSR